MELRCMQMRFGVEIDGIASAEFSEVRLPEGLIEVTRTGSGTDKVPFLTPGLSRHGFLVLKRPFSGNLELHQWFKQASRGEANSKRNIRVRLLGNEGHAVATWEISGGLPVRHAFSPLNAHVSDAVYEVLEIDFEEFSIS